MTLTNLTIKDLGDIVEASFQSEGCKVTITAPLDRFDNIESALYLLSESGMHEFVTDNMPYLTSSYLKQNLK